MATTASAFTGLGAFQLPARHPLVRRRPCARPPPPPMAAANKGNNRALPSYSARGFGSPSPSSGRHRRGSGDGGATSGEAASVDGGDGTLGFVGNDKMHIMFTCGVCDTRISKPISRTSYEKGVVLIQCPSCEKRHVIADNLGHFSQLTGGKKNVEEMVGGQVTRVNTDVYNLERLLADDLKGSAAVTDVDATSPASEDAKGDGGSAGGNPSATK
ncbi:hypothetical protein BU14_0116s0019 [Porphyra umbilicalis]|uniref:DNL-type domain-containing protein n=1 Tax=Porphyra umbilicalis TaxID=2786 RepID=A0A1X6PBA5_PORUM|nr:hypothetical protein BU14_0116s0019 [Porphyra umbilicalis]|eukprot:OSX78199.1 hypothetical protein BU14_0116s0019 [Porphyra umbilicalis]